MIVWCQTQSWQQEWPDGYDSGLPAEVEDADGAGGNHGHLRGCRASYILEGPRAERPPAYANHQMRHGPALEPGCAEHAINNGD